MAPGAACPPLPHLVTAVKLSHNGLADSFRGKILLLLLLVLVLVLVLLLLLS